MARWPSRRVAVLAFAAALAGLSLLHLGTGLADNGDFDRSTYFLLEKPAGFATNWPPYDTPERARRILGEWHDRWELAPDAPRLHPGMTASSYKAILAAQVGLAAPFLWSALRVTTTPGRAAAASAIVLAQAIALVPRS